MKEWVAVGLAGMAGAVSRTAISHVIPHTGGIPYPTLLVNLSGAFLLCALIAAAPFRSPWKAAVQTGFLGSFTTFSALSAELSGMMADEQWGTAFIYGLLSVGGGLLSGLAGQRFGKGRVKP
ncbi:MAG: fluoride efflux transporter FluC [Bhargavaea sp.]